MATNSSERKLVWLLAGAALGLTAAAYWPQEPAAFADSTAVGSEKFSMCTVQTAPGDADALFILDHTTGRLSGAIFNNSTGQFAQPMLRPIAQDFELREAGQYIMVTGFVGAQSGGGAPPALGGLYVAELTSGKMALYGFRNSPQANRAQELVLMAMSPWRAAN